MEAERHGTGNLSCWVSIIHNSIFMHPAVMLMCLSRIHAWVGWSNLVFPYGGHQRRTPINLREPPLHNEHNSARALQLLLQTQALQIFRSFSETFSLPTGYHLMKVKSKVKQQICKSTVKVCIDQAESLSQRLLMVRVKHSMIQSRMDNGFV